MSRPIKIEFFHDTVCAWCFNLSSRLRTVAQEIKLDIRHRTFVLQASRQEMAQRWGSPEAARSTILDHWRHCRAASDQPEHININAMRAARFDYPHGMNAALACKAAETFGGQALHWEMFDRIQLAHLSEARNIADPKVLVDLAQELGLTPDQFKCRMEDPAVARQVDADRHFARVNGVQAVPTLIIAATGTRLLTGSVDELRSHLRVVARQVEHL
ncbi:DsbA family protein [Pseudophaeobacter sp. C1-32P7]|uniref:DsbA family oxidoreductase n=1 Tax=Pseudophaeobacter sp. C1-32P7 TaxID=3098142 RepID=UPI0034D5C4B9